MKCCENKGISPDDAWRIIDYQISLPAEKVDTDLIDYCHNVIGDNVPEINPEARRRSWKKVAAIIDHSRGEEPSASTRTAKIKRCSVVALLVTVSMLLIAGIAFSSGILPWTVSISWNDDSFSIKVIYTDHSQVSEHSKYTYSGLSNQLDDALIKYGMNIGMPTRLPDGFYFSHMTVDDEDEFGVSIVAAFTNGDANIIFDITEHAVDKNIGCETIVEKSDAEIMVIKKNGVQYYLYSDTHSEGVIWFENSCTVVISGKISRDEVRQIIYSIR